MPINPVDQVFLQRELVPEGGGGWVTTDLVFMPRDVELTLRGQFTTLPAGGSESSGEMNFRFRFNGGAWTEFVDVKIAVKDTWYEVQFIPAGRPTGLYEFQISLDHPSGTWTSNTFSVTTVGAAWNEGEAPDATWSEKEAADVVWTERECVAATWTEREGVDSAWTEREGVAATYAEGEAPDTTWTSRSAPATTWSEESSPAGGFTERSSPVSTTWSEQSVAADAWEEKLPTGGPWNEEVGA
jgi:hypothetical protein